jgi:hypothetical protein
VVDIHNDYRTSVATSAVATATAATTVAAAAFTTTAIAAAAAATATTVAAAAAATTYTKSLACTNNYNAQHALGSARTLRFFGGEGNADVAAVNVNAVGTVHGSLRKRQFVIDRVS